MFVYGRTTDVQAKLNSGVKGVQRKTQPPWSGTAYDFLDFEPRPFVRDSALANRFRRKSSEVASRTRRVRERSRR